MAATTNIRTLAKVAAVAWLIVAADGVRGAIASEGDDWELAYNVFLLGLLVGTGMSVAIAARVTEGGGRPRLRTAGLVVGGLGVVASFVAWAIPLWTTVIGAGLVLLAMAAAAENRRPLLLMAAACPVGLTALIIGIEAEVGRRDEWGDYPVAAGLAVVLTATLMVAGIVLAARRPIATRPLPVA